LTGFWPDFDRIFKTLLKLLSPFKAILKLLKHFKALFKTI